MLAINENKNENYMSEKEKLEDIKEEICNATATAITENYNHK